MPVTGGGAMRLTTALYFTPSGRSIQKEGIKPDIEVEQAKVEPIKPADRTREENLRGSITNPNMRKDGTKPPVPEASKPDGKPETTPPAESKDGQPPKDPNDPATQPAADYQLQRAVDLIRGIALYSQRGG
jgi:carboxyl-terminal processing protease